MYRAVTYGVAVSLVLALTACGDDGDGTPASGATTSTIGGPISESTCEAVLTDPFFEGAGRAGLSFSSGASTSCTLEFRASDAALQKLGISTSCPAEASIIVAVDIAGARWSYDERETRSLDNGECAGP